MRTTTTGALAEAITTRVLAIAPSSTAMQGRPWRAVDDIDAVQGGEIRTFYVDIPPETVRPVTDGIYSPAAIEHECTVEVWTSYGNVKRRVHRALAAEDARDVWLDLEVRRDATTDNTIAGLVSVEGTGWQAEDDEQGRHYGAHTYYVRFLAQGIPGAS